MNEVYLQELEKFLLGFKFFVLEKTDKEKTKLLFGVKLKSKNGETGTLKDFVFENGDFLAVKIDNIEKLENLIKLIGKMSKEFYYKIDEMNKYREFSEIMRMNLIKKFNEGWYE